MTISMNNIFSCLSRISPCLQAKNTLIQNIYIGLTKWNGKKWIGKLYPPGIKHAHFLENYSEHYNNMELNASHYKTCSSSEVSKSAIKGAGKECMFGPKILNSIIHSSGFKNAKDLTTVFLEGVLCFGDELVPMFLQMIEKFSPLFLSGLQQAHSSFTLTMKKRSLIFQNISSKN